MGFIKHGTGQVLPADDAPEAELPQHHSSALSCCCGNPECGCGCKSGDDSAPEQPPQS